jgi:hypothetical protein
MERKKTQIARLENKRNFGFAIWIDLLNFNP